VKDGESTPKVVFLPHYGEWGWFILHYIRLVHYFEAAEKMVCCRKGQEVYFPMATGFFYDWTDPIPDRHKKGYRDYDNEEKHRLIEVLGERFPDFEIADQTKLPCVTHPPFEVVPCRLRGLHVDVLLGARRRQKGRGRNWPHWQSLAHGIVAAGLEFGVIGSKGESYHVEGSKHNSWDFEDDDATVEMLSNCRVFVGTNSGTTHLATFLSVPTIEFDPGGRVGLWIRSMEAATSGYFRRLDERAWNAPELVLENVVHYLAAQEDGH